MAKRSKSTNMPEGAMDMTSMIDCVFLLIIFFMVSVDLKQKDNIRLTLPDADSAISEEDAKVVINIERSGDITTGGRKRSIEELKSFLLNKYQHLDQSREIEKEGKWASVLIKIRADEMVEFRDVQKVLSACIEAKFYKTAFGAKGPELK